MKSLSILAAVLVMAGTPAMAQEAGSDQAAKDEKKICKSEKITGSLTRVRRTCMTQRQWDQLAEATRKTIDDVYDDNATAANQVLQRPVVGSGG